MKKIVALVLILVLMLSLAGCFGVFECDTCGETKFGEIHTYEFLGQKIKMCDDCYNEAKSYGADFY